MADSHNIKQADSARKGLDDFRADMHWSELFAHLQIYRQALNSIAANTCCDRCQEAALVARAAIRKAKGDE